MKRHRRIIALLFIFLLFACGRLDDIPYSPEQTPHTWCENQPCRAVQAGSVDFILSQPTSTVIVYFLGLLTIGIGAYFLRIRGGHRSRMWWGVSLLLWGVGAICAGTSYQAFGYEIKCAGRDICAWTSWWEVVYLMLSMAALNAMLIGEALSCTLGGWRKALSIYAIAGTAVYTSLVLAGAFIPVKFLVSFEFLVIFSIPNAVAFPAINGLRYFRHREKMDLALLVGWALLAATMAAYYLYMAGGYTQSLWALGIWFSDNDVLHIGMIICMAYIGIAVAPKIRDLSIV